MTKSTVSSACQKIRLFLGTCHLFPIGAVYVMPSASVNESHLTTTDLLVSIDLKATVFFVVGSNGNWSKRNLTRVPVDHVT